MYDPFMYEGKKYLMSRAPTKSTVYGNTFRLEFGQPYRVEAPVSKVIWVATNYIHEIEEVFEKLET